ncbi:MAG TPA: oxygen-independent coproporphyrinogen III oxidase [Amaricoccus sp.]|nr:oxygen-independent coproporphyrinogen III oxidase [Amaricoccus sp.]
MDQLDRLRDLGLFDTRVPRYTSYPTAPNFSPAVRAVAQAEWLGAVDPGVPVSVYLHIPFCERLCWFCACHTQGTKTLAPVEAYVEALEVELGLVAERLPAGVRMGRLHWGGGTPTILPPRLIHRLAAAVRGAIPPAEECDFSVEIDPTLVDRAKIEALAEEGLTRASLGIQDFDPVVQQAIGRLQSYAATRETVEDLRACGVASLNTDLVYGLPHQSEGRLEATVGQVLTLAPDRVAIFGYAHVPWASKRQRLIDETALPGDGARVRLAGLAAEAFEAAGYRRIGIDHFARPGDGLERAAVAGRLRRNFQGYTDDDCPTLIGLGASSISRFPQGYVHNAAATHDWQRRIAAGELGGARGHVLDAADRVRARAIEMLLCDFRLDFSALGPEGETLRAEAAGVAERFGDLVALDAAGLSIRPEGVALARIVASAFDGYLAAGGRFSRAS